MITKLAKAKDNWFFKILSAAVAVSFISLFGVTGYIGSASQNQTVIKVGHKKTAQSEFAYRIQKETNALRNLAGDDYELSDEMRNEITESVIKQFIEDGVIPRTDYTGLFMFAFFIVLMILNVVFFIKPMKHEASQEEIDREIDAL